MATQSTTAALTPPSSTPAVDVTARRSCRRCNRRMSSLTYDKHTMCVSCRDVVCSVEVRCNGCREWSTDAMAEYVRHKRSLVCKGKKPKVTTPSISTPSVTPSASPTVVGQVSSPSLSSIADDDKIKSYIQSVPASMLSQPSGQISFGSNPFFSAPSVEVPDIPSVGSTVGRCAESLSRGRTSYPAGVVPPSCHGDVMPPPIHVSVSNVDSVGLAGVSGSQFPLLGVSTPVHGRSDQLRDRGDIGLTQHVISADVHSVPRSVSSFDPSSLLFPFSDSGFSSLSAPAPPVSSFSSSSSSSFSMTSAPSFAPPSTVPVFSLPSVFLLPFLLLFLQLLLFLRRLLSFMVLLLAFPLLSFLYLPPCLLLLLLPSSLWLPLLLLGSLSLLLLPLFLPLLSFLRSPPLLPLLRWISLLTRLGFWSLR